MRVKRAFAPSVYDCVYSQSGRGWESGFYRGGHQRGHGLGSLFKSLGRTLLPLVSKGAKALGKQVLETGATVASDVLAGHSFGDSIKQRGREAGAQMLNRFVNRNAAPAPASGIKRKRSKRIGQRGGVKRRKKDIFN